MEITYKNKNIQELCEQNKLAVRKLGNDSAKKLAARLSDFRAADFVTSLPAGKPHPLVRDRKGQYAVSLAGGCRVVFIPDYDKIPIASTGGVDWARVEKIKIIEIGDYHD